MSIEAMIGSFHWIGFWVEPHHSSSLTASILLQSLILVAMIVSKFHLGSCLISLIASIIGACQQQIVVQK
jgi:hypothetical protein